MAVERYQRSDGSEVYMAVYLDDVGKKHREVVRAVRPSASKKEHELARKAAALRASERRVEVQNGTWARPEARGKGRNQRTLRLHDLFDRFLRDYRGQRGKNKGKAAGPYYEQSVQAFKEHITDRPAKNLTASDVRRFVEKMRALKTNRKAPPSDSTIRKRLIALSTIFRWGIMEGLVESNPTERVARPGEPASRSRDLTETERAKLLEACPPDLRRMVRWMIGTGMDRADVLALTWADIDRSTGTIWAPRQKTGARRELPLNEDLRAILEECKKLRSTEHPEVFLTRRGWPWTKWQFQNALVKAYDDAGLDITQPAKTLRHCFASDLMRRGVHTATIAALMGQTETHITSTYMHVRAEDRRAAMEAISIESSENGQYGGQ